MKIIGITGGVGTGKSQVLDYLEKNYGAVVCQADEVSKRLQRKGTKCFSEIVCHFGPEILDREGRLDRSKLAGIVFSDREQLQALNEIVHPAVKEKIQDRIRLEKKRGTPVFVLEAALFIEENYGAICDEVWYIYTDEETRKKRLMASRGYSKERTEEIMASQRTSAEFFSYCDRAVDNCHSFQETCEEIDDIMERLHLDKVQ